MMTQQPGPIVLMGSGETAPNMQKVYHWLFQQIEQPPRVAILETPAGFEVNSQHVASQIGAYLQHRLQNFNPQVTIVPVRKRGTPFSPDDPALLEPLYSANVIMMGPGSPSYVVRQLRDSAAWHTLRACHQRGAALVFASAATLAVSAQTLPVYEIYKVGEDLHWKAGLNLLADFGLSVVFVSHWNNRDGGEVVDTSRCYMGQARFAEMLRLLPGHLDDHKIVGIDEKTALVIDLVRAECSVLGAGEVTIIRCGCTQVFSNRAVFDLHELGKIRLPISTDIPADVWQRVDQAQRIRSASLSAGVQPPDAVLRLVAQRQSARANKEWATSDALRAQIALLGWRVLDTAQGAVVEAIDGQDNQTSDSQ